MGEKFTGQIKLLLDKYGVEITTSKHKRNVFRVILPHKNVTVSVQGQLSYMLEKGNYTISFKDGECTVVTKETQS